MYIQDVVYHNFKHVSVARPWLLVIQKRQNFCYKYFFVQLNTKMTRSRSSASENRVRFFSVNHCCIRRSHPRVLLLFLFLLFLFPPLLSSTREFFFSFFLPYFSNRKSNGINRENVVQKETMQGFQSKRREKGINI